MRYGILDMSCVSEKDTKQVINQSYECVPTESSVASAGGQGEIPTHQEFHKCVQKMRSFFEGKGFIEVHPQNKLSILAACEDPTTMATYNYSGNVWPLPQTGQMWLEHYLLDHPEEPGFFCISTSYRNEPNPVPGRHDKIFPMCEFETKGGLDVLIELEKELLEHLGFSKDMYPNNEYPLDTYDNVAERYGVSELEHEHEDRLEKDHGPVFFLTDFPERTSPFWNMKLYEGGKHAKKVDVIIHGIETIGSAERSCDKEEMRHTFNTISNGEYANTLFAQFSKERVQGELNEFMKKQFIPRCGGGIGVTRMIRAMKMSNLL
jgi:aspartyl/asparaginyl-tRNA synthetase